MVNDNGELVVPFARRDSIGVRFFEDDGTPLRDVYIPLAPGKYEIRLVDRSMSFWVVPRKNMGLGAPRVLRYSQSGALIDSFIVAGPGEADWIGLDDDCNVLVAHGGRIDRLLADLDGDGLCDMWESRGLAGGSGLSNWEAPGATAYHKNIFLEYDAMDGAAPLSESLNQVEAYLEQLANNDFLVPNPDNGDGISVFVDSTQTDTSIAAVNVNRAAPFNEYDSVRALHFAQGRPEVERRSRARMFRYALYFGDWEPTGEGVRRPAAVARASGCWDIMVRGSRVDGYEGQTAARVRYESGMLLHELGHTMGLRHGGTDDEWYKPNYHSVMNYLWTTPSKIFRLPWRLALSDTVANTLNEAELLDATGIGGGVGDSVVIGPYKHLFEIGEPPCAALYPNPYNRNWQRVPENGAIDYDCTPGTDRVQRNINYLDPVSQRGEADSVAVLYGADDVATIKLVGAVESRRRSNAGPQNAVIVEDWDEAYVAPMLAAFIDCDGNDVVDGDEIDGDPSKDRDCDWWLDVCQDARVTASNTEVVACPAGDRDSLLVHVRLLGMCDGQAAIETGAIFGRITSCVGNGVALWRLVGSEWVVTDTLDIVRVDEELQSVDLGAARVSGCGTLGVQVYVNGRALPDTVTVDVRNFDVNTLAHGAVDHYDVNDVLAEMGAGGGGCGDFNWSDTTTVVDVGLIAAHLGHALTRKVVTPNGGEAFTYGQSVNVTWREGQGDSSRVTVSLLREGGAAQELGRNLSDDGQESFYVYPTDAPRSDYRIRVVHTAGILATGREIGRDSSDATFAIDEAQGGGCPFLYARDVTGWNVENSILGRSTEGVLTDVYALSSMVDAECGVRLKVIEDEHETTTLDWIELLAVDHPPGALVYHSGERFHAGTRHPAARITSSRAGDITRRMADRAVGYEAFEGETLFVEMLERAPLGGSLTVRPGETQGGGGIIIDDGGKGGGPPKRGVVATDEEILKGTGFVIQVADQQGWRDVARRYPREQMSSALFDSITATDLRLIFHGRHRVGFVGRLIPTDPLDSANVAPLGMARHSRVGDVRQALTEAGALTTRIQRGDTLDLMFEVPALRPGLERQWFLVANGAYTSAPDAMPEPARALPRQFALQQNRPNPFGQSTTIAFDLPVSTSVTLELFDALGRRVKVLVSGSLSPGSHSVEWDARDATGNVMKPGVYVYRLEAGSFRSERKLVLLP
jgi:hypothetical protein